ncbi:MAG TPA: hypothetical protein VFZ22_03310 [Pyrinomonadaceae bacterium]|nr:hypothetical protein [Pyrinomonadaceae bacterium]
MLQLATFVLVVALGWGVASGHRWVLVSAEVSYNGQRVPEASVYRSAIGDVLVDMRNVPGEGRIFVIYSEYNRVGLPSVSSLYFLPGCLLTRESPPLGVFLDDRVKFGVDPQLRVTANSFEFSSQGRIRIVSE